MTSDVYITGCGAFLPGAPVSNEQMAARLGGGGRAAVRERILAANGIRSRHYALDEHGATTMLNEELAAEAVERALKDRGLTPDAPTMLTTGTTLGDLLVPGFASMVHGRLGGGPLELLSAGGVCASSLAAFKAAVGAVRLGEHRAAVVVGSELVSRTLRADRFVGRPSFDAELLRWTLSDGAGAVVVESQPRPDRPSLRVDWVHLASYAHEHDPCMTGGATDGGAPTTGDTWLDQPSVADAERRGMLLLRQNVRTLPALFEVGLRELVALTRAGRLDPAAIDHVLCHYSAEHFKADIFRLLREVDLMIDEQRWFTNLHTKGNTGAASIWVMLEECWAADRFRPGDRVLLIVPESGRFSVGFAQLTCVSPRAAEPVRAIAAESARPAARVTGRAEPLTPDGSPLGVPLPDDSGVVRWTVLELAQVWSDFERRLAQVPVIRRIETGAATLDDYRRLLVNLRQQVVEGGRWIARAASSFSVELFELRSAAIMHAAEEHRDYQMLERDFGAVGGHHDEIVDAQKNIGSAALSAFMFHQASQPDPVDLLGAMFVIEGLGTAKALRWARLLQEQLGLVDDQMSFLRYHADNDGDHFKQLHEALRGRFVDRSVAERIIRTARVVARLYALQLEEVDDV